VWLVIQTCPFSLYLGGSFMSAQKWLWDIEYWWDRGLSVTVILTWLITKETSDDDNAEDEEVGNSDSQTTFWRGPHDQMKKRVVLIFHRKFKCFEKSEASNIWKDLKPLHILMLLFMTYWTVGGGNLQLLSPLLGWPWQRCRTPAVEGNFVINIEMLWSWQLLGFVNGICSVWTSVSYIITS